MDDLKTSEVQEMLNDNRKRILKHYDSISKKDHIDGSIVRTIDMTQLTWILISKKIIPNLIPKSALARLFKNVQQKDIFADDAWNEYLNEDQYVQFVGALGLLAFKLEDDIQRKFPTHELKIN